MRVLFGVFGSAGDVLPSVAVARELRTRGAQVAVMAPRSAGLYARAADIESLAVGDGREMGVLRDAQIFTTRFDGFESWRRTLEVYLSPLVRSSSEVSEAMAAWAPDLVVVHPLATYVSLAAETCGLPWVSLHLYPQLVPPTMTRARRAGGSGFAPRFAAAVAEVERRGGLEPRLRPLQEWGWSRLANLSVHDPALVSRTSLADREVGELFGFPYFDGVPTNPEDVDRAVSVLGDRRRPSLVVSLGSFVGKARNHVWARLGQASRRLGVSCVAVGVPGPIRAALEEDLGMVCTGFVPHSELFGPADAVVHHGGIGSTYAGLLAGKRCGVLPQAFDQCFNSSLLEQSGLGARLYLDERLERALQSLLEPSTHKDAAQVAASLTTPAAAACAIADRLGVLAGHASAPAPRAAQGA